MKKSILFFTFLFFISTFSFASFPVSNKAKDDNLKLTEISFPVSENNTNEKQSFFKSAKEYFAADVEWGSFFAGFLLGIIGVLFVYVFDGDASSAWKGFGVAILLYLLLYFALLGAVVAAV